MTWRELAPEKLYTLRAPVIIDVRSPCEHIAENIPGSINVPLLENDERARVGTVYKQQGEMPAKQLALKLISPKIPEIVDRVLGLRSSGRAVVVHCWRGGLRSEAVASFLALVGVDCWRLTGGYKQWRKHLLDDFAANAYPFETIVIDGLTGTGKTDVLRELRRLGAKVIDLEELANHRGSVFGGIGLGTQPTQKNFEAALWNQLRGLGAEPVFIEAESRKVGNLAVPDCLLQRMQKAKRILVSCSIDSRVSRLQAEYRGSKNAPMPINACIEHLQILRQKIGSQRTAAIQELAVSGDEAAAIKMLLMEHYDPLYNKQIQAHEPFAMTVLGEDSALAAQEILAWRNRQTHLATMSSLEVK